MGEQNNRFLLEEGGGEKPILPDMSHLETVVTDEQNGNANEARSAMLEANEISLEWKQRDETDDARVGAAYCFKNCGVNKN